VGNVLRGEKNMNAGKDFNLENDDLILQLKSPVGRVDGPYSIVYKSVDERLVVVAMEFDGQPCLGVHLFKDKIGWPASRGIPTWCVVLPDNAYELLKYFEFEPDISESLHGFLSKKIKGLGLNRRLYLHLTVKEKQKIKKLLDDFLGDITEDTFQNAEDAGERINEIEHNTQCRKSI
jgi:hypothetical protein